MVWYDNFREGIEVKRNNFEQQLFKDTKKSEHKVQKTILRECVLNTMLFISTTTMKNVQNNRKYSGLAKNVVFSVNLTMKK